MRLKLVTPPESEPVELEELKTFLRISDDSEDELLEAYIVAARQQLENIMNRSFITQTWRKVLDAIPGANARGKWWNGEKRGAISDLFGQSKYIQLENGQVQSITSFKYFNYSDEELTYDPENYFLDDSGDVNRLVRKDTSVWPSALRTYSSIQIDYVTGYGEDADSVPQAIKMAIKLLASHYYENRGECSESEISNSILTLIDSFAIRRLG